MTHRHYVEPTNCHGHKVNHHVLGAYAQEIREHASNVLTVYGLSPQAVDIYKRRCFQAADLLEENVRMSRGGTNETITYRAKPAWYKRLSWGSLWILFGAATGLAWNYVLTIN